jgi:hypothetical protein
MHRASGCFEIHYVELFVEERVETHLPHSQSLLQVLNNFLLHVVHSLLVTVNFKERSHLIFCFVIGVETHVGFLLQFFLPLVFLFAPIHLLFLILKEGGLLLLHLFFFLMLFLVKLFLQPAVI